MCPYYVICLRVHKYLKWKRRKFRTQNFLWKLNLEEARGRVSKNISGKMWMDQ